MLEVDGGYGSPVTEPLQSLAPVLKTWRTTAWTFDYCAELQGSTRKILRRGPYIGGHQMDGQAR